MFTYDVIVSSYTGMVAELLAFASVVIAMIRYRVTPSKNTDVD